MRNHMKLVVGAMAVMIGLLSAPLWAQDEVVTAKTARTRGTIEKVDDKSVTIKNEKGKSVTFVINEKTQLGTKKEPKKASDFKVGDLVVVAADRDAKGAFVAMAVFVPKGKPAEQK